VLYLIWRWRWYIYNTKRHHTNLPVLVGGGGGAIVVGGGGGKLDPLFAGTGGGGIEGISRVAGGAIELLQCIY
jgi:hypothetical protein